MGFWIFMFFVIILIPGVMVGFGIFFSSRAPRNINFFFGYRTEMSMKNDETWEFAHRYFGEIWKNLGWLLLFISIGLMLFNYGESQDYIGNTVLKITLLQLIFLIGPIFPTERALRDTFDSEGNFKDKNDDS